MENQDLGFKDLSKSSIIRWTFILTAIFIVIIGAYLFMPYFIGYKLPLIYLGSKHEILYNLTGIFFGCLTTAGTIVNLIYLKLNFENSLKLITEDRRDKQLFDYLTLLENNIQSIDRFNHRFSVSTKQQGTLIGDHAIQAIDRAFKDDSIDNIKKYFNIFDSSEKIDRLQAVDSQSIEFYNFFYQQFDALCDIFALHFETARDILTLFKGEETKCKLHIQNSFIKFFSSLSTSQRAVVVLYIEQEFRFKLYNSNEDLNSINIRKISLELSGNIK